MKLIIAGSRSLDDLGRPTGCEIIETCLQELNFTPTEIISGMCPAGPDGWAILYARRKELPLIEFEPDWDSYGRQAGPMRNLEMADYGDALLLLWDGESGGSRNMRRHMKSKNKPTYEVVVEMDEDGGYKLNPKY